MFVRLQVCYAVARPRLEAKMFRAVMPLAVVNVLNLVCGLVGGSCAAGKPTFPDSCTLRATRREHQSALGHQTGIVRTSTNLAITK